MLRTIGKLLLAAFVIVPAMAGAADAESAPPCTSIESDADRLACYDRLFKRAPAGHSRAATDVAVAEETRRDFGLSEAERRRNANQPAPPRGISVTIQSIGRRPTGEQIFHTSDGQTWVEVEPSTRVRVQPGETITIREAALGSYLLVTSTRVGTKVRRVK
jgi:hypothetical protein